MFGKNGHLQVFGIPPLVNNIDLPLISDRAGGNRGCRADAFSINTFDILDAERFGPCIAVGWIYFRFWRLQTTLCRFFFQTRFSLSLRSGPFLLIKLIKLCFRLHFAKAAILRLSGLLWNRCFRRFFGSGLGRLDIRSQFELRIRSTFDLKRYSERGLTGGVFLRIQCISITGDRIENKHRFRHFDDGPGNAKLLRHIFTSKPPFAVAIHPACSAADYFIPVSQSLNTFGYGFRRIRSTPDYSLGASDILGEYSLSLAVTGRH